MLTQQQIEAARAKMGIQPAPSPVVVNRQNELESAWTDTPEVVTPETPQKSSMREAQPTNKLGNFLTTPKPDDGLGKKVARGLLGNVKNFGESIGGALAAGSQSQKDLDEAREFKTETQTRLIKKIKEKREKGEDVTWLLDELKNLEQDPNDAEINPAIEKTGKQVAGEAVGVAADVIGAGSLPSIGKGLGMKPATTLLGGLSKGALSGAVQGAGFGGVQGIAKGMQDNKTGKEIAAQGVIGAGLGGVAGGIIGGITGGISGSLRGRALKQGEAKAALEAGELTNADTARYANVDATQGKLKTDPVAKEAIRQGIPERDIAIIKAAGKADREKFKVMASLAEKASKDRTVTQRPMDIAGETAIEPAKFIQRTLDENSKRLDKVAERLVGQPIEADDILTRFDDDLARYGISVDDTLNSANEATKSKLNFEGSDFEGTGANEKIIDNVYRRINSAQDAHDFHRVKKYIDNNVDYGKAGEGLTGATERLLKGWRNTIDTTLDVQFPEYNEVNSVLSENIGALDKLNTVMGTKFRVNDPLANIRAGQVSSRLLGNSPNRGEILNALSEVSNTAQKYGFKSAEDPIYQVNFADILEDVFGTPATRSLKGEVTRAGEGVLKQLTRGETSASELLLKGVASGIENARNVTPDMKVQALKALLEMVK